eukprot:3034713-Pyramimonas_sp.AAC.1
MWALPGVFMLDLPHGQTLDRRRFVSAFRSSGSKRPEDVTHHVRVQVWPSLPLLPLYSLLYPLFCRSQACSNGSFSNRRPRSGPSVRKKSEYTTAAA